MATRDVDDPTSDLEWDRATLGLVTALWIVLPITVRIALLRDEARAARRPSNR